MDSQKTTTITDIPHRVCRFYAQPIVAPYTPSKHVHLNEVGQNGNQFQKSGLKQPLTCGFMMETVLSLNVNGQFLYVERLNIV